MISVSVVDCLCISCQLLIIAQLTYLSLLPCRAPEVILGLPYDSRIDVWSVGAVIAELFTNYVLFQNDSVATMLARITGILGPFPDHVLAQGREATKFFSLGQVVYERDESNHVHLVFPKRTNLAHRLHLHDAAPGSDEASFIDFVRRTLHLDPSVRPTAYEALQLPWLQDADTVSFEPYIIAPPPPVGQDLGGAEQEVPEPVSVPNARSSAYVPFDDEGSEEEGDAVGDDRDDEGNEDDDDAEREAYLEELARGYVEKIEGLAEEVEMETNEEG